MSEYYIGDKKLDDYDIVDDRWLLTTLQDESGMWYCYTFKLTPDGEIQNINGEQVGTYKIGV